MIKVVLESPFAGEVMRNIDYARECVKDSLKRGEAPIASHLLYTQNGILDDDVPGERALGINAGHAWIGAADYVVFYVDFGMSNGMIEALKKCKLTNKEFKFRLILNQD